MFDFSKFLAGFNLLDGEKFGKILFYAIIITVALCIYNKFTTPTSNKKLTLESGSTASDNINQPKSTFGCSTVRVQQYFEGQLLNKEVSK